MTVITIHLQQSSSEDSTTTSSSSTTSPNNINIVTNQLTKDTIPSKYIPVSTIHINIESSTFLASNYDPLSLASLIPSLRKDGMGQITFHVLNNNNSTSTSASNETKTDSADAVQVEKIDTSPLHTSIMLAGLISQSEQINREEQTCSITAIYKPKTKHSTSASISIRKKITINLDNLNVNGDGNADNADNADDDDMFVNEDDLLASAGTININAPEEIDMSQRKKQVDDCGGRKACDDCTCGRKEMEEGKSNATTTAAAAAVPKSSCGNCAKGDAFRCAGCPFLGKPAFKEGEEHLVLDLMDDL